MKVRTSCCLVKRCRVCEVSHYAKCDQDQVAKTGQRRDFIVVCILANPLYHPALERALSTIRNDKHQLGNSGFPAQKSSTIATMQQNLPRSAASPLPFLRLMGVLKHLPRTGWLRFPWQPRDGGQPQLPTGPFELVCTSKKCFVCTRVFIC